MTDCGDLSAVYIDCAPFHGGAQRSFADLVTGLCDHRIVPHLLAADNSRGGLLERCAVRGIGVRAVPAHHWGSHGVGLLQYALDRRRWRRVLPTVLGASAARLVHLNGIRAGLLVADRIPGDTAVVLHDRDLRGGAPWVLRRLAGQADRIIAISEGVAQRWEGISRPGQVEIIHNGFPLGRIAATEPTRSWCREPGALSVVLVADLVRWKGHGLLLQAVSRLHQSGSLPLNVALVGRCRDRQGEAYLRELQRLAGSLQLAADLVFATDVSDAVPWIAAADVLVSTAAHEPFGRTVVEALALGKPVVAVRGGGPEEILAGCEAACLVEADPDSLAAGLAQWGGAARRRQVAEHARRRAGRFDLERMLGKVRSLYDEVLAAKPSC